MAITSTKYDNLDDLLKIGRASMPTNRLKHFKRSGNEQNSNDTIVSNSLQNEIGIQCDAVTNTTESRILLPLSDRGVAFDVSKHALTYGNALDLLKVEGLSQNPKDTKHRIDQNS